MTGSPPLPRSGRLMAGGANSLELLWAIVALITIMAVVMVSAVAWIALRVEAVLSGSGWPVSVWDMPRLLLELALDRHHPQVAATVTVGWRPAAVAAVVGLALTAVALWGVRAWIDWRAGWRHRQKARDRLGSRAWARRRDLTPLLATTPHRADDEPPARGRLLVGSFDGHDVLAPARTSVMVIAPTRTGKTSRLVVPNLLRWEGPAVVTSVKRDIYDLTAHRRIKFGPVHLFDPTGATGIPAVRWSPLLTSTTFPDATKTATWLADAAAVEDRHESAKFWETLATKLLGPMLYAAASTGCTIHQVSHWVDRSAFDDVAILLDELGDDDAAAAWQAICELPLETRGSVLGTAMAIFRAFGSPRVRQATSCTPGDVDNTLAVGSLLRDNGTLYLVSPEYEQAELRPVFVALIQAVYRAAVETSANLLGGGPLSPPLLMMLDEAGNIAPLQSLPKIASTGAGQGITLMTIWQDRAQIRQLYKESDRTVISNHTSSVWLPGSQDLDTLKLLADLIGDQWVASTNVSAAPDGGLSVSEGSERMDVAPPAFLRTLDHDNAVLLTGNRPPALIGTHAYYQQRRWRRLVGDDILAQHAAMHAGGGPTTRQRWDEQGWPDGLPERTTATRLVAPSGNSESRQLRDEAGWASSRSERFIECDSAARMAWGRASSAIPDKLSLDQGDWRAIELPSEFSAQLGGVHRVNLADTRIRRLLLPIWLQTGPGHELAVVITLPQLKAEWRHLELSDDIRRAWEDCYPGLGDDIR